MLPIPSAKTRWLQVFLALTLTGCGRERSLPELPKVPIEMFTPTVRAQIRDAYAAVQSSPSDAQANGKLGMVLEAYELYQAATRRKRLAPPRAWQSSIRTSPGRSSRLAG
jgi:hypothetical protein